MRPRTSLPTSIALLLVVAAPAAASADGHDAQADLVDARGAAVGTVTYTGVDAGVRVHAELHGLDGGSDLQGFHLHENGVCEADAEDGPFTTAGGHWNPGGTDHAAHAGDLPPLLVRADGGATATFVTDRFTIDELLDGEVAQILHADRDNLGHIPERYTSEDADEPGPDDATLATGDAGDRAACGVVVAAADAGDHDGATDTEDDAAEEVEAPSRVDAGSGGQAAGVPPLVVTGVGLGALLLGLAVLRRRATGPAA